MNFSIAKYISVALASSIKFLGGPLAGVALGLPWLGTAAATLVGMMCSVLIFMYLGEIAQNFLNGFRKTPPKLFSKRTRLAVRVFRYGGIHAIAFLTPLLFSPIGGTLLAVSFKVRKSYILLWMFVYGTFWALVQSYLFFYLKNI